jgi:hypothetical protein
MLTVWGSVASRFGPRDVATAWTVGRGVVEFGLSVSTRATVKSITGVAVGTVIAGVAEADSGGVV